MTAPELTLDKAELRRLAESALAEDRADRDVTTAALVPEDQTGRGLIIARAEGILAGLPIAQQLLSRRLMLDHLCITILHQAGSSGNEPTDNDIFLQSN